MSSRQQLPVLVLKEGTQETKDKDAQKNNVNAAKLVAQIVRSSLGPRGMDKMLVSPIGDVTVTNDGATILKEIDVEHPAAKMMVEISKATDNEVGDGTTSTVVLAGSLLEKAESLLDKNVHSTVIVEGFKSAAEKSIRVLRDQAAIKIDPEDRDQLNKVAQTSLGSKMVSVNSEDLADIVVHAVLNVSERNGEGLRVDIDNIKVEKKAGGSIHDTKLIRGIVLDKEVVHSGMPKRVHDAKIALLNSALEIEKPEFDAKINVNSPDQMQRFLDEENKILKSMVDRVLSAGTNVLLCSKGIDDIAQHYLNKAGILAVRRIKESDMAKLSKATGAKIVTNVDELTSNDLGTAKLVEERKIEADKWVFIEQCKNPKSVSILVRGGSERVVDEAQRSIHDAIMSVKDVVEYPYIVVGGGAPEAIASHKIREWAGSLSGRAQLAAESFADGLETIPLVLAENAGMDPIDTQVQLRAKISTISKNGKAKYGVDVIGTKIADLANKNIYEPLAVKEQVINSAVEAACMILRIDNVIAASKTKDTAPTPPGRAGGMGGEDMSDMDM
jgi:archaeal chaperonin